MKFSTKITVSMGLLITIVFSLGGYFMIRDNFDVNLSRAVDQNLAQHTMERYALESSLNRQLEDGGILSDEKVLTSLYSLANINNQKHRKLAAFKSDKTQMYASDNTNKSEIFKSIIPKEAFKSKYQIDTFNESMNIATYIEKGTYGFYLLSTYDISYVYRQRTNQLQTFFLLDLSVSFLSFVIIYLLTRYLTKPIKQLSETSKQILNGSYEERCDVKTHDEIGELANSFNQMSDSLATKIYALEDASEQKDAFIASFTHELKTPMTAIIGYSDLLRQGLVDDATAQMAYEFIFHEGKRLELLSHDLLEIFMMQNTDVKMEKVEIATLCSKIHEELAILYPDANISLRMKPCDVWINPPLIDCLIRNLVSNAVNADGSPIDIFGVCAESKYVLAIRDCGHGISEEALKHIKEPFYRVDASRSRASGGNGLGLSICEKIAQVHNTTLEIKSRASKGTLIKISFMKVNHES